MINKLDVSNFKAFGPNQSIPIKPLTLIFGANSAGKSSIIHSLILVHEAFATNELDVFKSTLGGDSVDLGGFKQYVHRRDDEKRVTISLNLDPSLLRAELPGLFENASGIVLTIHIAREKKKVISPQPVWNNEGGIDWVPAPSSKDESTPPPCIVSYEIGTGDGYLLRMSRRQDNTFQLDTINDTHPVMRSLLEGIFFSSTTATFLTESDWETIRVALGEIIPKITASAEKLIPEELRFPKSSDTRQDEIRPVSKGNRRADIASAMNFLVPKNLNNLVKTVYKTFVADIGQMLYLGPLRSYPERLIHGSPERDTNWKAGGGYAWNLVLHDRELRDKVNEWLSNKERLSTPYKLIVESLQRVDLWMDKFAHQLSNSEDIKTEIKERFDALDRLQNKQPPEEAAKLNQLGILGKLLIAKGKPSPEEDAIERERERFYPIDAALNFDYPIEEFIETYLELLASSLTLDVESKSFLSLLDCRTLTSVSHRDVGIGISQVLPVLVYAFANKSKMIAIEQPEIHLHPALQAELGDVFIESALGENKNTFVLETHSEHLILRVMRRMRETFDGNLPGGLHPLTSKDVSILYVEPDGDKSIVREMPLNDRGELIKSWPGGFFEEGLREVFA